MSQIDFAVLTPKGSADPAVAVAASRAGALGLLNLEGARDISSARRAIDTMLRHARGRTGIRLDTMNATFVDAIVDALPLTVDVVVVTPGSHAVALRAAA